MAERIGQPNHSFARCRGRTGGAMCLEARLLARHVEYRLRLAAGGERSGKLYLGLGDDRTPLLRAGAVEYLQAPVGHRGPVGKA